MAAHTRSCHTEFDDETDIDDQLWRMWDADSLAERNVEAEMSPDEKLAVCKAEESMKLYGVRYEIGIPWKENTPNLPNNRKLAESRLKSRK